MGEESKEENRMEKMGKERQNVSNQNKMKPWLE